MTKGIQKIAWVNNQPNTAKVLKEQKGSFVVIEADKFIWFTVSQWFSATTEAEKKGNISWILQDRNKSKPVVIQKNMVPAGKNYGLKIPKKLCGVFSFYVEASLTGNFNVKNITGLLVVGACNPKITASKWCVSSDGSPAGKTKQFAYGEKVYLNLDTEGMNGLKNVMVEIYRKKTGFDQLIYTVTKVLVEDGEINIEINKTANWFGLAGFPTGVEEYYVQVKLSSGNYVLDDHNDEEHARFLRIKPEQIPQKVDAPKNTTASKIGKPDENKKNYHPCRFSQINIEDNGNTTVFNEGVTLLKKQRNTTRNVRQLVHFDYDRDTLRTDAKQILDRLLDFLLYNPHLDIRLDGHADDRGELNYNQALSERRAEAVKNYFFNKGLKETRIITRGFGEARNAVAANNEEQHSKNRRTQIDFSYIDYDSDAILYQTIAGSILKPKKVTFKLLDHKADQCMRSEDKHTKEITVQCKDKSKKKLASEALLNVNSCVPPHFASMYAAYLIEYLAPHLSIEEKYLISVHTCAYFADKQYPTLDMRIYPDLVWIANLQYNFEKKGDYFFHDKKLELTKGIKPVLDEYRNTLLSKIMGYLPANFFIQDLIFDYIEKEAEDYSYAGHIIHERSIEKAGDILSLSGTSLNLIKETKYTKYAAAAVIYGLVVSVIIIDLIIIYLTRGRNLAGRAKKIQKVLRKVKALKKMLERKGDVEIEILPPSIAVNAGMYYYQQADKRVAMVYEANIKADPLIAIEIKKEFDLLELLDKGLNMSQAKTGKDKQALAEVEKNKPGTAKVKDYLKELGISVKGEIVVTGEIGFEHHVKFNVLTKQFTVVQISGNALATHENERLFKTQISFNAKITGSFEKEFEFFKLQTKIEGKLNVEMYGSLAIKIRYGVNTTKSTGMYMQPIMVFSGLKGIYSGNYGAKVRFDDDVIAETSTKITPTPFTLIEPFELDLLKMQLFDQGKDKKEW